MFVILGEKSPPSLWVFYIFSGILNGFLKTQEMWGTHMDALNAVSTLSRDNPGCKVRYAKVVGEALTPPEMTKITNVSELDKNI